MMLHLVDTDYLDLMVRSCEWMRESILVWVILIWFLFSSRYDLFWRLICEVFYQQSCRTDRDGPHYVHSTKEIFFHPFDYLVHFVLDFRRTISIIGQTMLLKMIMAWKGWTYLLRLPSPLGMEIFSMSRYGGTGSGNSLQVVVLHLV